MQNEDWGWIVPRQVFLQACKAFEARRLNNGSWVGGIPESVLEIKRLYVLDNSIPWMLTVEAVVGMMAVSLIAREVAND